MLKQSCMLSHAHLLLKEIPNLWHLTARKKNSFFKMYIGPSIPSMYFFFSSFRIWKFFYIFNFINTVSVVALICRIKRKWLCCSSETILWAQMCSLLCATMRVCIWIRILNRRHKESVHLPTCNCMDRICITYFPL